MTKLKSNEYIVFQPDQVLTSDNLNQLFHYLDQQNRWTRNKLLGMGIVCGLDLVVDFNANSATAINSIEITKGCGITSEGYLILEKDNKTYTHAIAYSPLALPADLPFNCPNVPFYQTTYTDSSNIFKLITCDQYNLFITDPTQSVNNQPCQDSNTTTAANTSNSTGTAAAPPQPFALSTPPTGIDLSQYVVVLFLEASEKSATSCNMQDCNNNGDQMVFTLTPLLVPQSLITDCSANNNVITNRAITAPEIKLRRYNVPYKELTNTETILEAFLNILYPSAKNLFDQVLEAYKYSYSEYGGIMSLTAADNPIPKLQATISTITTKLPSYPFAIEYIYDYLNDLTLAYYEFLEATTLINSVCCANTCCFPLHLVLGAANQSTNYLTKDVWRQYFIYSPLFNGGDDSINKLRFYFERMFLMSESFNFTTFESIKPTTTPAIGITPSQYENFPLSERAIPYYYTVANQATPQDSLYRYWNYEKTITGYDKTNLSYNAKKYNTTDDTVYSPLLYDIEKYNFFRIEGHIGKDYTNVLNVLLADRLRYNLPFDVVAISSSLLTNYTGTLPECNILDIETDYYLLVCDFLCSLILCIIDILLMNSDQSTPEMLKTPEVTTTATTSIKTYISNFKIGKSTYNSGDFITAINPPAGTIGATYASSIQNGSYTNPVAVDTHISSNLVYYHTYNVLNSTDKLFSTLLNNNVQGLSQSTFTSDYATYTTNVNTLKNLASSNTDTTNSALTKLIETLLEDCCCSSLICIYEEFLVLIAEYLQRLKNYEAQLSFLNYYKNHPGLEHKAGVPKGGTFVIVYNEQTDANAPQASTEGTLGFVYNVNMLSTANISSIATGVVIADFYIPYLCCSDCAPVAYIVEPAAILPSISVAPATANSIAYCSADLTTTGYLITTSPTGGVIAGPGTSVVNGYFFPNKGLTAGIYTLTYTVNQQVATTYVEIVDPPKAEFDYDIAPENSIVTNYRKISDGSLAPAGQTNSSTVALYADVPIQFINNSVNAASYLWNFLTTTDKEIFVNADLTAAEKTLLAAEPNPKCIYSIPVGLVKSVLSETPKPEIKVSLTAKNTTCQDNSLSQIIKSNAEKTYTYVALNSTEFIPTDTAQYPLQLSSGATGTVSGSGVSKSSTGVYQFSPLNLPAGTYPLTYTGTEGVSTFNVTVKPAPEASFTTVVSPVQASQPNQVSVQFTNTSQNADTYSWSFGDGETSTEASPSHTYALSFVESKKGIIPVTLTANNGVPPGASITNNVVVAVFVSLAQASYCNTDSKTSIAPTTNISGGVFSVDGVAVQQSTGYKFSPLNMSVGPHHLTYTYNNLSATFEFTITSVPQLSFKNDAPVSTKDGISVSFVNTSGSQNTPFTWDFGDDSGTMNTSGTANPPAHIYSKKVLKKLYTTQQKAQAKGAPDTKTLQVTVTLSCSNDCGKNTATVNLSLDVSTFS